MKCRGCGSSHLKTFLDLGFSPIANNLLTKEDLDKEEVSLPLHTLTCEDCALVQLPGISSRETLFHDNYTYYSSFSESWLAHCRSYAKEMIEKLVLTPDDLVVEIASNDGYMLQYFREAGIKVLGVEPAAHVAKVAAEERGVPTVVEFFGEACGQQIAQSNVKPRLMIANNVLAHVPDLHDFLEGFASLIADDGCITFEFPHVLNLILLNQFDTIYHEHYSYLGLMALEPIFLKHGLRIFDVHELDTHGGSLRVFVCKTQANWKTETSLQECIAKELEHDSRLDRVISQIQMKSLKVKTDLIKELSRFKESGQKVAAYGAAAKGNTLLNFAGIKSDMVEYVVDRNPYKQGHFLPGSHIPIVGEDQLKQNVPDILLVLPWNLSIEIGNQLDYLRDQGVKFMRAIPSLEYF